MDKIAEVTGFECPICRKPVSGYRNIGRQQWLYCEDCGVTWLLGENIFSSWRQETVADWVRNLVFLSQFKKI